MNWLSHRKNPSIKGLLLIKSMHHGLFFSLIKTLSHVEAITS
jgi:hypothetical protein